ncbi:hypothetical protein MTBBW1_450010 [Desulfamplus magnetovallimortis]|uniref:Uncharacterized protein n=1 Tax=Desulfamplus magnetovallimortis TaxID=1246637 RepID=A0A1W1HH85_9BACT|nr:hypothetical protein MTBBW1_450010 [Desulfamplus magnetovallimortis]
MADTQHNRRDENLHGRDVAMQRLYIRHYIDFIQPIDFIETHVLIGLIKPKSLTKLKKYVLCLFSALIL